MPGAAIGMGVALQSEPIACAGTICAIDGERAYLAVHGAVDGIVIGTRAVEDRSIDALPLGTCALGRAIDARGMPLDGGAVLRGPRYAIERSAPLPDERCEIDEPLWTGVRAIDALLTIGRGARVGVFGAPGVGKSTLFETIVRGARVDATVVGLVGERGREAQAWIEHANDRTSVVCATSDRPASERVRAAHVTMAQAQALADRGLHVLVILDSLARVATAMRELALAAGESLGRGGYPPSVFADLAHLVERAGATQCGSITLLATVLNDGDDRDPVSEAARSLLDGHIQLSPRLAHAGHFPAIDVLSSASRTMSAVVEGAHGRHARTVRSALALLDRVADARSLGIEPSDPRTRAAMACEDAIGCLLRQGGAPVSAAETVTMLADLADTLEESHGHHE